ncbi:MAG: hypothetical protein EPN47_18440 [Acidobacteria bacterium]|nr:MAG: hypothetical protein EPN47_18440 [Acidobacteriota bacterium]
MKTEDKLKRVFVLLVEAVRSDPTLAAEIDRVLDSGSTPAKPSPSPRTRAPRNRREPAALDPYSVYEEGEGTLRARLGELDVEALKDIVAEYGMDQSALVLKWKKKDRILDHIVNTVQTRSRKGDAFRA